MEYQKFKMALKDLDMDIKEFQAKFDITEKAVMGWSGRGTPRYIDMLVKLLEDLKREKEVKDFYRQKNKEKMKMLDDYVLDDDELVNEIAETIGNATIGGNYKPNAPRLVINRFFWFLKTATYIMHIKNMINNEKFLFYKKFGAKNLSDKEKILRLISKYNLIEGYWTGLNDDEEALFDVAYEIGEKANNENIKELIFEAYNNLDEKYTRGYKVKLSKFDDSGAEYINFYGGNEKSLRRPRDPRIR